MGQEVSPAWDRLYSIIKEHARTISIGALIIAVAGGGFLWNRSHRASLRNQAAMALREGVGLFYASRRAENPDFQMAIASLSGVTESYPGTGAAGQAALYLGHIYYAQGNYPAALERYQKAVSELTSESPFMELALLNVAYALEAKREFANARAAYKQVLDLPKGVLKDRAVIGIGRCYEAQGDLKTAFQTYKSILKRFPNSPWIQELRQRMDMLEAKKAKAQL